MPRGKLLDIQRSYSIGILDIGIINKKVAKVLHYLLRAI